MQFEHVAPWTCELDTAAEFRRRTFGAPIGERCHSQRRPRFVSRFVTRPGGADKIELTTGPRVATAAEGDNVGWDHVAILLGDGGAVHALAARCATEGLLVSPPRSALGGVLPFPADLWRAGLRPKLTSRPGAKCHFHR